VEYKHGSRSKAADIAACDDLQLAAQAVCLETMTGKPVLEGALYYASSKRRRVVQITKQLRDEVAQTADAIRHMLNSNVLPPPLIPELAAKRCKACSLIERCQPQATHAGVLAARAGLFDPDA
jgi:CRISPR-associated exonuclease Cas4